MLGEKKRKWKSPEAEKSLVCSRHTKEEREPFTDRLQKRRGDLNSEISWERRARISLSRPYKCWLEFALTFMSDRNFQETCSYGRVSKNTDAVWLLFTMAVMRTDCIDTVSWLWWCFHGYKHKAKFIKLYPSNIFNLL